MTEQRSEVGPDALDRRVRLRRAHRAVAALACASLVLRALLSDAFGPSKWNLYLPPLLLVPVAVLAMLRVPAAPRVRRVGLVLVVGFGGWALHVDQPHLFRGASAWATPLAGDEAPLRLVLYNVKGLQRGGAAIRRVIEEAEPDGAFLVQADRREAEEFAAFEGIFEGRSVVEAPANKHIAFGSGALRIAEVVNLSRNGRLTRLDATLRGIELDVLLVHLRIPTTRDDALAFAELEAMAAKLEPPALVLGDFNAPRGSRRLARALRGWDDLSRVSEDRLLLSWRTPWMLWQIDHVFARGLEPLRYEIRADSASDHAAIVVDLALPSSRRAGSGRPDPYDGPGPEE